MIVHVEGTGKKEVLRAAPPRRSPQGTTGPALDEPETRPILPDLSGEQLSLLRKFTNFLQTDRAGLCQGEGHLSMARLWEAPARQGSPCKDC